MDKLSTVKEVIDAYRSTVVKDDPESNDVISVCEGHSCDKCELSASLDCDIVLGYLAGKGYTFEEIRDWLVKNKVYRD